MNRQTMPQFPHSYWYEHIELPNFNPLAETVKTEVAIVGGGITGITTAYLLSKKGVKVTLIDAGSLLSGTTGHTTAKVTVQHGLIYDQLINNFDLETAKLYYAANKSALEFISNTVDELQINCDFEHETAYLYTNSDDYIEKLMKEKDAYEQIGIDHSLVKELPINIPIKLALKIKKQAKFHPLKYLTSVINECVKHNVQFYENTVAVDLEYTNHPVVLTKEGQRISCDYVILASHYPFYDGLAFFPTRMYADRSYIAAFKYDEEYPGGMYISAESPNRSIRTAKDESGEDILLIGGESHKVGQGKMTIEHYEALQKFAVENFKVGDFLYRWSAQDLVTLDNVPYIGSITKSKENILVATGFRKWGMTTSTVAAQIFSDTITNHRNVYKDIFAPSRKVANNAIKNFIKYNADVAKHLIKGKMEYAQSSKEIEKDTATIMRIHGKRAGVYRDLDDKLHIVDTTCTHLGCEVNWNDGERTWDCPCHGSRFSYTGEVIDGPAKEPLERIKTT